MIAVQAPLATEASTTASPANPVGARGASFARWIERELEGVNGQLRSSDRMVQDLAMGKVDNLHHVMIEMEKSRLSLQLLLQVRNHVLDAYHELVRLQP